MFTVLLDKHAAIWKRLLEFYLPYNGKDRPRVIDFTAGTKATWWDVLEQICSCCNRLHYDVTWCDRDPLWQHEDALRLLYFEQEFTKLKKAKKWTGQLEEVLNSEAWRRVANRVAESIDPLRDIVTRDIDKDRYIDLGMFNAALFDPPYLIGRDSFDYPSKNVPVEVGSHSQGMYGPRSWGSSQLGKYVANPTVESFNERVAKLNEKAGEVILKDGYLFVKVMNPRHDKRLVHHDVTMMRELTNFECVDRATYIRQGATTWSVEGHMQNLNGSWMVFQRK